MSDILISRELYLQLGGHPFENATDYYLDDVNGVPLVYAIDEDMEQLELEYINKKGKKAKVNSFVVVKEHRKLALKMVETEYEKFFEYWKDKDPEMLK